MKKIIEWKTGTGQRASVEVEMITWKTIDADGITVEVECCEMQITGRVDGVITGIGLHEIEHPLVAAKVGKLGIARENLDRIKTAIAEIEATPEWTAKVERERINRSAHAEIDAARAKMNRRHGFGE